jgi:DnaK suppressor protein
MVIDRSAYLAKQEMRIIARIKRCEKVVRGRRLDASLKANHVLPAQRLALARLRSGIYGICVDCEDPIDPKRLEKVPAALRCVGCQTESEK